MSKTVHRSETRGLAEHGWLISRHSFSFADYHNPERMGFGLLRVLNDDIVRPAMGFGTHPHKDMEIISIPLSGELRHEDSMNNRHVIRTGEVQVMSAGTGATHSEFNNSDRDDVNFLQIWIHPRAKGLEPRYSQKRFAPEDRLNRFQTLVAPEESDRTVAINQEAWISLARIEPGRRVDYRRKKTGNGLYCFVLEGRVRIENEQLGKRDAIAMADSETISVEARDTASVLCIDVPMNR